MLSGRFLRGGILQVPDRLFINITFWRSICSFVYAVRDFSQRASNCLSEYNNSKIIIIFPLTRIN
jgi:hypothetical protein